MTTPVRRQYLHFKARYPDAILFFRLGDFYETFDDDAELVSRELGITLTSKPMGAGLRVPLAGVPVKNIDHHLGRLIERGHRVAVCEQLEDPRASRGLVRRGVVRVVSPGTALEPALLEAGEPSACAAIHVHEQRRRLTIGLACADITTGRFHVSEVSAADEPARLWEFVSDELRRAGARELLMSESVAQRSEHQQPIVPDLGLEPTHRPARDFRLDRAADALQLQFAAPPEALALDQCPVALGAAGALLAYLHSALPQADELPTAASESLRHLEPPRLVQPDARLQWDAATERALGLVDAGSGSAQVDGPRTLLDVLDRCGTVLGRRWLRTALRGPLLDLQRIERRLDRIQALLARPPLRRALASEIKRIPDLERLLGRASAGVALPPELAALARGLVNANRLADPIDQTLSELDVAPDTGAESALAALAEPLREPPDAARVLSDALVEQPSAEFGQGVIRAGIDPDVDRAMARSDAAHERLARLEADLRAESGIDNLKIGYHRTFGHYIELRRGQSALAPDDWERRQSLRDRERYSETRLRQIAEELDAAQLELTEAERAYVDRLRAELVDAAPSILRAAGALARLDVACALADVAADADWNRPELSHGGELVITSGRHPVVEAAVAQGGFVPNDLNLADDGVRGPQLLLVTGPNMAGKSTYLRQAALIVILAQMGSYVPAASAQIGMVDRMFARVGAHDDLAAGRSTFLVEMLETARLLHGATDRSLILLDEIGRGTSTWDGLAIAQAVAEALASEEHRSERGPRTLFATHFHELTALAGTLPRIANAAVQVEEDDNGGVQFLHRIRPGAADRSFGVHVAAQAGIPPDVVARAADLLAQLESQDVGPSRRPARPAAQPSGSPPGRQLTLMPSPGHPILHDLADLDIDGITPLEAISALYALRDQARRELRALSPDTAVGGGA